MKPYGYTRRDCLSCDYGCCGLCYIQTHRSPRWRKSFDRSRRKRARQEAKKEIASYLDG